MSVLSGEKMMKRKNREIGAFYERLAGDYLEKQGYTILEYNFTCRTGEIDIIAKEKEYLVFCEVKYRKNNEKGNPFEAVNTGKQRKISECALCYLKQKQLYDTPCRFDVIGILGDDIELLKNAFDFVE